MSGSFGAEPQALATAASAFQSQADPILQQAQRLETIHGTAQTTGRDYAAQGDAYHQVITGPLNTVVRSFGETCLKVSSALTQTQQGYQGTDASGSGSLRSAGGQTTLASQALARQVQRFWAEQAAAARAEREDGGPARDARFDPVDDTDDNTDDDTDSNYPDTWLR